MTDQAASKYPPPSPNLVWVDLETPGFRVEDGILEVSMVITDNELVELGSYTSVVCDVDVDLLIPSEAARTKPEQILCWDKHWETGLITDLKAAYDGDGLLPTLEEVQANLVSLMNAHGITGDVPLRGRAPLCGSTVASFDRPRIERFLPHVFELLHYRNIDVSTILELQKRWAPDMERPPKSATTRPVVAHRAEDDIKQSIGYLKHFRDTGFIGLK